MEQLDPPMFERLVAEVAMRVDGHRVRVHARSGQAQRGLDIWGGSLAEATVYQVRRVSSLSAAALRRAVEDYAGPPHVGKRQPSWTERRFDARRFVLATGCIVADDKVDLELQKLRQEYAGDLTIELWDNRDLSRELTMRGPIVAGIFGEDVARVYCGYHPPSGAPVPTGNALLADPVVYLGLSSLRDQAATAASTMPGDAAALHLDLADRLNAEGFAPAAAKYRRQAREQLAEAGRVNEAMLVAIQLALDAYEAGDNAASDVGLASTMAKLAGTSPFAPTGPAPQGALTLVNAAAARVATAISSWAEAGYEVASIAADLRVLADADHPHAANLTMAVAEQVVTDNDPVDEIGVLHAVCLHVARPSPPTMMQARLSCCLADLDVRAGADPREAFRAPLRQARGGKFPNEGVHALILRRAAYAHALAGHHDDAIGLYEESVRSASDARLGGDARDALRGVRFLTTDMSHEFALGYAASAVDNRARLFPAGDRVGMSTLESLVDDQEHMAVANALFKARTGLRIERVSGGAMEMVIAHRRHGQVLLRANEFDAAVVPLVRAGHRNLAREAAEQARQWQDVRRFLRTGPSWTVRAACAATAAQADLVPDDEVADAAATLSEVVRSTPLNTAKEALLGLAGLGQRVPVDIAQQVLDWLRRFLDRAPKSPAMGDKEAFAAMAALARHPDDAVQDAATGLLVEAVRLLLRPAVDYLIAMPPTRVAQLKDLAAAGNDLAATVLAFWRQPSPAVTRAAEEGVRRILEHQLGPRTNYSMGSSAPVDACAVAAVLADNATAATKAMSLTDQLADVIEHLISWAEDRHDIAGSRSTALGALRILSEHIHQPQRGELHQRLLTLADQPDLHPADLFDQASTHLFSRAKFNTGSEHFAADALLTATHFASTEAEAAAVARRLTPALTIGNTDDWDVDRRGRTLNELERLHPTDLTNALRHPSAQIRATATRLWANRSERSPSTARALAADPDRRVRHALAVSLVEHSSSGQNDYPDILTSLASDPSHLVRAVLGLN
ncbi:hypothetical protein [Amycolatopsis sp. NPDC052450]|uniref:hypothetical protein n=1 Tax=Amycolatopsis sp. NPDC052450 TaxID=3363937 RepID=UPI0037C94DB3